MIYTIFTLSDPANIPEVRFVGVTTQPLKKRLCDIISVAKNDYASGHNSLLSQWIRELLKDGKEPWLEVMMDTYDKDEAIKCRVEVFNEHLPSGRLLNTISGTVAKLRTDVEGKGGVPGRQTDDKSLSARYSLNRKQVGRGEAELILRPYL